MVNHIYVCPHCGQKESVVRCGFNRGGTQRLLCKECGKTWAPHGKSRTLSGGKGALIEKVLGKRLSQRAIARTLSVSRDTVQAVLKKISAVPAEFSRDAFACDFGRCFDDGRVSDSLSLQATVSLFVAGGFEIDTSGLDVARG